MTGILIKLIAVVALLGALFFGYQHILQQGRDEQAAIDQVAIDKIKGEAKDKLALETARADDLTAKLQSMTDKQNEKDQEHETTVTDLYGKLAALGKLRDPHASGCRSSSSSTTTKATSLAVAGAADGAETDGVLSAELSGLLRARVLEADQINNAYDSCRTWSATVKQLLNLH